MRCLNQGKNIQAVLAPSPLTPLPRWGEGNRSLSSFPKDGEHRHSVQFSIGDPGDAGIVQRVCDTQHTIHVAAFRKFRKRLD
jgi:hypothetical protein